MPRKGFLVGIVASVALALCGCQVSGSPIASPAPSHNSPPKLVKLTANGACQLLDASGISTTEGIPEGNKTCDATARYNNVALTILAAGEGATSAYSGNLTQATTAFHLGVNHQPRSRQPYETLMAYKATFVGQSGYRAAWVTTRYIAFSLYVSILRPNGHRQSNLSNAITAIDNAFTQTFPEYPYK